MNRRKYFWNQVGSTNANFFSSLYLTILTFILIILNCEIIHFSFNSVALTLHVCFADSEANWQDVLTLFWWLWKLYLGQVAGSPYPPAQRFSIRVDAGHVLPHLLPGLLIHGQTTPINDERDPTIPLIFSIILLFLVPLLDSLQTESSPQHLQSNRSTRLAQTSPDSCLAVDDSPRRGAVMERPAAGHRHGQAMAHGRNPHLLKSTV